MVSFSNSLLMDFLFKRFAPSKVSAYVTTELPVSPRISPLIYNRVIKPIVSTSS